MPHLDGWGILFSRGSPTPRPRRALGDIGVPRLLLLHRLQMMVLVHRLTSTNLGKHTIELIQEHDGQKGGRIAKAAFVVPVSP